MIRAYSSRQLKVGRVGVGVGSRTATSTAHLLNRVVRTGSPLDPRLHCSSSSHLGAYGMAKTNMIPK